ncbi:probable kinetochore protein NUF2 [Tanacetum coccineum]
MLKILLRKLLFDGGNLHDNVNRLRAKLDQVQADLDADPYNISLREVEAAFVVAFNEATILLECFLKQKAKIDWLKEGDSNSAYFHKTVRSVQARSPLCLYDNQGTLFENDHVADVFVSYYVNFLGEASHTSGFDGEDLFQSRLADQDALNMVWPISRQEVKDAMEAWDIMEKDVIDTVSEFFINGKILKQLNHTIIALFPKVKSPARVNDYRPISCCNVIFKCISKIIANRIKDSLKVIVSSNQSAFVPGRNISDNILLTQELMHNYHLNRGTPRCAFKVDIQKAYDTVDWDFLQMILVGFGFHPHDLFLFSHGDTLSTMVIKEALEEFYIVLLVSVLVSLKGKANVAWEDVCRPKKEGDLGLRRLNEFNKALMILHVWKLISLKGSLWVQRIHEYKIRGRNFGISHFMGT